MPTCQVYKYGFPTNLLKRPLVIDITVNCIEVSVQFFIVNYFSAIDLWNVMEKALETQYVLMENGVHNTIH